MGMSMHDRYYEPEDGDDIDEYVADWIEFESREGGDLDPRLPQNFYEAVCELGLREDLETYDDCTEAEKAQILAYMLDLGEHLATESFYNQ
jgi:hypothetical protein